MYVCMHACMCVWLIWSIPWLWLPELCCRRMYTGFWYMHTCATVFQGRRQPYILSEHTYIHTYMHTYIHTYITIFQGWGGTTWPNHTCIHTYTSTHACIHTYIHALSYCRAEWTPYAHTYVHTCLHVYTSIHTYIHALTYFRAEGTQCGTKASWGTQRLQVNMCMYVYMYACTVWFVANHNQVEGPKDNKQMPACVCIYIYIYIYIYISCIVYIYGGPNDPF